MFSGLFSSLGYYSIVDDVIIRKDKSQITDQVHSVAGKMYRPSSGMDLQSM